LYKVAECIWSGSVLGYDHYWHYFQ